MVIIRLSRGGAKHRPFYNIVATDSRNRRDGRFLQRLGFYNPIAKEGQEEVRINLALVQEWVSKGAQMSPTVARLVKEQAAKVAE